jgi:serine/threonine protein kinase
MTLSPRTRLGPYEVLGLIGAGGMGQVFRARDARLGREVAVKVLPPELLGDPERLARFEREARVLATLNHPNVAAIYGLEDAGGSPATAGRTAPFR